MFSELIPNRDAAGTWSSAGSRQGEDWNETQEARNTESRPRVFFFGRQQGVKFTEFLECWLCSKSRSSFERRAG